jgi:cathepsin F
MKSIIILSLLAVASVASIAEQQTAFIKFIHEHGKQYASKQEYDHRYSVFVSNLATAQQLTAANGGSAQFGVTQFMDLTPAEFRQNYLNAAVGNKTAWAEMAPATKTSFPTIDHSAIGIPQVDPTNFNWADHGVVTPVYNQAQCGSCWAFSATETIESYYAIAGHGLHSLSMEQVVECDTTSYGCNGGWTIHAYQYVEKAGGIDAYSEYPYTSGDGITGACRSNLKTREAKVTGYRQLNGETGIHSQASTAGPVSVCVDAASWQFYKGGVLTSCGQQIDHCVQVTGYANYGRSGSHWIVRNS